MGPNMMSATLSTAPTAVPKIGASPNLNRSGIGASSVEEAVGHGAMAPDGRYAWTSLLADEQATCVMRHGGGHGFPSAW